MAPSPYIFIISIGPVDMNQYARFDEIPSMSLKDIKETKRYARTDARRDDGRTDNQKTVYPPTNTVCGGYNYHLIIIKYPHIRTLFLLLNNIEDLTRMNADLLTRSQG